MQSGCMSDYANGHVGMGTSTNLEEKGGLTAARQIRQPIKTKTFCTVISINIPTTETQIYNGFYCLLLTFLFKFHLFTTAAM